MNAKERLRTLEECSRAKNAKITVQFDLNSKRLKFIRFQKDLLAILYEESSENLDLLTIFF